MPITGGTPVRLNPALSGSREVRSFKIGPDGARVVYAADEAGDWDYQLFSVPIAGGVVTTLTDVLPPVSEIPYQVSPDGGMVLFLAGFQDLYNVPITGGTPLLLYSATEDHIVYFAFTPDSNSVVFLDYYHDAADALYTVPVGGGTPVRLDAPSHGNEPDIFADFRVSPDGSRVVYRGDQDTAGQTELYSVPTAGGTPTRLNGPLATGGDVAGFDVRPDSTTVVYRADQEFDGYHELYRVPLAGGSATKISHPLYLGDDIEDFFFITSSGTHVFYIINQDASTYRDLHLFASSLVDPIYYELGYLYAPNNSSLPIDEEQFKVGADGRNLVYAGVAAQGDPIGLYSVPMAGGTPVRLDGPLVAGGEVDRITFQVSPDSQTAVYCADQDTDEVFEVYASTNVVAANLQIEKTARPSAVAEPGDSLIYTLTFGNSGEATASGVMISDTIPAELMSLSYDFSGVAVTPIGGIPYLWQVSDLAPGAGGVITVSAVIRPEVSLGTVITNSATITCTAVEADTSDNTSEVTIRVEDLHEIYLPIVVRNESAQ